MKRLSALFIVGTVFAGVFAAAALLEVDASFVQAGTSEDLTCQEEPVRIANYGVELDSFNLASFRIHSQDANGFTACEGGKLVVRLYNEAGNDIGGGSGRTVDPIETANGYPNSVLVNLVGIDSRDVHEIRVVIQSN